jgi:ribosomal protein S18 acetylase RimI-like enzyme
MSAMSTQVVVRRAGPEDAPEVARLLHDFNTEFDEPSPGVPYMTDRTRELMANGEVTILLAGDGPDGISVLRLRPGLWSDGAEAYLQELYVDPKLRGQGLGRALMEATIAAAREAGADFIHLGTSEDDTAARGLYESFGLTNREGRPDGPVMFVYERDL